MVTVAASKSPRRPVALFDVAGVAAEPSGAATVAAALEGAIGIDGPVVAIKFSGDMDPGILDELRQLVNHSGPLTRYSCVRSSTA